MPKKQHATKLSLSGGAWRKVHGANVYITSAGKVVAGSKALIAFHTEAQAIKVKKVAPKPAPKPKEALKPKEVLSTEKITPGSAAAAREKLLSSHGDSPQYALNKKDKLKRQAAADAFLEENFNTKAFSATLTKNHDISVLKPDAEQQAHLVVGKRKFAAIAEAVIPKNAPPAVVVQSKGVRANYDKKFGSLQLGGKDEPHIVAHEMGHWLEHVNPEVGKKAKDFLKRRTAGEGAQPLSHLTGVKSYGSHEIAKKDKFIDPYMGKIYSTGQTEIISMGIEHMIKDPVTFAKKDPEMFDFIYNTMKGK